MPTLSASALPACILALCLASALAQSAPKPTLSPDPLPDEQITIYRLLLADYNNGSKAILNVSRTTRAFEPEEGDLAGCMKGFSKESSRATVVHAFPANAFPTDTVRLVDPEKHKIRDPGTAIRQGESVDDAVNAGFANGLFTFSEIVFDTSHTHAALNYSFLCGSICGHGSTVIFTKDHGTWKKSKANCGSWIS